MKRFFSGSKNKSDPGFSNLSSSPKTFFNHSDNSNDTTNDSRHNNTVLSNNNNNSVEDFSSLSGNSTPKIKSFSSTFGKKLFGSDASPNIPQFAEGQFLTGNSATKDLSPELAPIITLLTAQSRRKYHNGVILLLHDLKNDGTPADRIWKEYFAMILGSQLALWDAKDLANNNSDLKNSVSKPKYLNFTDATLRPLDSNDSIISNDKSKRFSSFENVLIISTTLKNRYFLKFSDRESYHEWTAAIRLSLYENVSLQEAYTGAFLSSRGSRLGDIKNIMSPENKFTYSEWVNVRFAPGMPWKRCYAVISQSTVKKKSKWNNKKNNKDDTNSIINNIDSGTIKFYENDKKISKKNSMATVTEATALYTVYPSSPLLIDNSTIIKLDGTISFDSSTDSVRNGSIFIMAEKHSGVPSYDTIIRFLIPAMNAFNLYGRPKQLIANRNDPMSLMFALPTLPSIYYLEVKDIIKIINSNDTSHWNNNDWNDEIDKLLETKITNHNYTGCRVKSKSSNMYSSTIVEPKELFHASKLVSSTSILNQATPESNTSNNDALSRMSNNNIPIIEKLSDSKHSGSGVPLSNDQKIYNKIPNDSTGIDINLPNSDTPLSPQKELNQMHGTYTNQPEAFDNSSPQLPKRINQQDIIIISPEYSNINIINQSSTGGYESPYEEYVGISPDSKGFKISKIEEPFDHNDEQDFTSAHSSNFDIRNYEDGQSSGYDDVDDIPIRRTESIDGDLSALIDKINDTSIDKSKNVLIIEKGPDSFKTRLSMEPQMFSDDEIDPSIISGLHLNNISSIEEKSSENTNLRYTNSSQGNIIGVTAPQYFEKYQNKEA